MCGIIGFIGKAGEGEWRQTHSILRELFLAAEHRGQDATGFVAAPERRSGNRFVVAKEPVTASRFIGRKSFRDLRERRCSFLIGHVRLATHGTAKDNRNNHPHVGRRYALVHNGVLTNAEELLDRHSLAIESECDSEVLLRMVERSPHPALGLYTCLQEVRGSMAVALYDSKQRLVWLARNSGRPLWLARLDGDPRLFFASTAEIILQSLREVLGPKAERQIALLLPVPTQVPTAISSEGRIIAPLITVP
jgi:glucosamine--fructose-6-phosphate aminotransferase (isomerizing)